MANLPLAAYRFQRLVDLERISMKLLYLTLTPIRDSSASESVVGGDLSKVGEAKREW
jgi:hypothetical protein